ncbi:transient receptor potential cation channel family member painless [Calliopsis andreniformis]|uniref:transient receptor potential cation channel family member painless n=1 Tax=Calliopsis andreniformis TaxID=337506 RepID=UPI003FCE5C71
MDPEDDLIHMHLLRDYTLNILKSQTLHKQLLESLHLKDFKSFKSLFEQILKTQSTSFDVNYVHPNESDKTYLDIACKNGLTEFVKFLLAAGAKVNRVNESYNRGPIHFAAENGHTEVLDVLLDEPTINPNLEAGHQTALHMAVKRNDFNSVELLLTKGASPNIPNNKGLTALHMAAMKGQRDIVELILQKSQHALDLDSYKDYNDETTRDVLQKNLPDISLPSVQKRGANVHDLKYYLNANDEMNFFKCIKTVPDDVVNNVVEDLIEMAVQRNLKNTVNTLLEKIQGHGYNLDKAANIAIQRGSPNILELILNANGEVRSSNLLLNACLELDIPGKENSQIMSDRLKCLKLILERDDVDVRCTDSKGNTPLHYAARADCREAVTLLLEKGSYIGHMNNLGVPPVAHISESTLSQYFDNCIQTKKERPKEYTIEFDYKCLIPHDDPHSEKLQDKSFTEQKREMDVFQYLANNSSLKHLLKHPLLSLFLYLKWQKIRCILYVNFIFYFLLCVLLNAYVVFASYNNIDRRILTNSSEQVKEEAIESTSLNVLQILTGFTLAILVIREILQVISSPCHYVSKFDNWLEVILIFFGFWLLYDAQVPVAVVVILLSAWELVIVIGQHPWMSTDIEMFKKVSINFMRFLFLYGFLILSFALAFFALFKNDDNFPDIGHSLFKTIIMLTGEFDANDIPFVSYPILSRLVFVLFVFLIAIVLFNLLNGLAVSNTADILSKAELVGLITRIQLVTYIENIAIRAPFIHRTHCLLCHSFLQSCQWNPFAFLSKKILLFPRCLNSGKLVFPYDTLREGFIHNPNDKKWTHGNLKDKVFLDIMKQVNQILLNRDRESSTEKVISELEKIKDRLASIEISVNALNRGIENNNLNAGRDDDITSFIA